MLTDLTPIDIAWFAVAVLAAALVVSRTVGKTHSEQR